jgi:WD40 repeat protein
MRRIPQFWIAILPLAVACTDRSLAVDAAPPADVAARVPANAAPDEPTPDVRWLSFKSWTPTPLALDAAGRLVAVRTSCECIVYDLESGQERHRWNDGTLVAAFSRDGRFLVATGPNRVTLHDTAGFGERLRITGSLPDWSMQPWRKHDPPVISDDAELIAIPNERRSFDRGQPAGMLVYGRDGTLRHALPLPDDAKLHEVVFLRGDRLLLGFWTMEDKQRGFRSELWNPRTGERVHAFARHEMACGMPGGRLIAVRRRSPTPSTQKPGTLPAATAISIHEVDSGKRTGVIETAHPAWDFAWHPQGTRLLAGVGRRVVEWDMTGGDFVQTFESDTDESYASVAYAPDGRHRYATSQEPNGVDEDVDDLLCGWDVATGVRLPIERVVVGGNGSERLVFLPTGERFVDLESPFAIRDVHTGKTLQTVPKHPAPVSTVAFLGDENFLVDDLLTNAVSGNQRRWTLPGYSGRATAAIRDGRSVFSWSNVGAFITDVASGVATWRTGPDFTHEPWDAAADPTGRRMVFAAALDSRGADPRLVVLDAARPDEPLVLHRHATAVAVRPDGRTFLAASHAAIDELDIDTGELVRSLADPPGRVRFVTWTADGTRILAGGVRGHDDVNEPITRADEGWAVVIDAATGRSIPLEGHAGPVTAGVFSPDGRRCATGSLDTTIRLWATDSGAEVHCFRGHRGAINQIAFSPRGDRLLSGAVDGAVLWNVAGVVDPAVRPAALATEFEVVETVYADVGPAITASQVVPAAQGGGDLAPFTARVDWPVIHVGEVSVGEERRKWGSCWDWLALAPTVTTVPVADRPAAPRPFLNRDLRGTSRDGRRRLFQVWRQDEKSFIVADDRDEVLARVECHSSMDWAAIAPSGEEFLVVHEAARPQRPRGDGTYELTVYDAATGRVLRTLEASTASSLSAPRIDPLGRTFLLRVSGGLELRDFATGRQLVRLAVPYWRAEYSPDGRFIVTHRLGPAIQLRDPRSLDVMRTLENHLPVRWVRISPDGRRLLAGQPWADGIDLVTAWDVDRGTRQWSRCGPAGAGGTFSADERAYLSGMGLGGMSWDAWALWDLEQGRVRCVVVSPHDSPANAPVFGPDGESLYRGSPDGPRLWPGVD